MASEVIHIGREMRDGAYVKKGRRKVPLRVSPDAVQEMISYIKASLDRAMNLISETTVKSNHPQTVYSEDVINHFAFKENDPFVEGEEE